MKYFCEGCGMDLSLNSCICDTEDDGIFIESNGFDNDINGWTIPKKKDVKEIPHVSFEDMLVANLEPGKRYSIEYSIVASENTEINITPRCGSEFTIDGVVIKEIKNKKNKKNKDINVPKGMSQSYFYLMKNSRKKKGLK